MIVRTKHAFRASELTALVLLLGGAIISTAVSEKALELLGQVGWNRTSATVMQGGTLGAGDSSTLSRLEVELVSRALREPLLAYEAEPIRAQAAGGRGSVTVEICGVSATYRQFLFQRLRRGGFFTEQAERMGESVVVIGDDLAWTLFLTHEAVGLDLRIWNRPFRIVGVYEAGSSLFDALLENGYPRLYVPISAMPREAQGIFSVQVADALPEDLLRGLQAVGKGSGGFAVTGFQTLRDLSVQKNRLPVFLAACAASVAAVVILQRRIRLLVRSFRAELQSFWFWQAARRKLREILVTAAYAAAAAGILYALWRLSAFRPVVPAEYMPDRLIDLGYYVELARRLFQQANRMSGFIPPRELLVARHLARMQSWLAVLEVAGGALLVHVRLVRRTPGPGIVALGLEFALAVVIATAATFLLGMPAAIGMRDLFVVGSFCLLVASVPRSREVRYPGRPGDSRFSGHADLVSHGQGQPHRSGP